MPEFINVTLEQVERYWSEWLIHRSLGKRNHAGGFEPNYSFIEAMLYIPDEMLRVFNELDSVYGKMERQYIKQTSGRKDMYS